MIRKKLKKTKKGFYPGTTAFFAFLLTSNSERMVSARYTTAVYKNCAK